MFLQEGLHDSQPQAVPYAAAVADPDTPENAGPVDQGIEHGLATSAATDQADVAYTQTEQSTEQAASTVPQTDSQDAVGSSADENQAGNAGGSSGTNRLAEQVRKLPAKVC